MAACAFFAAAPPLAAEPLPGARELRGDAVRVVFWPGHEPLARRTLDVASRPPRFPGLPDDPALTAGTIYLAPSPEHFRSLTGGRIPEWGAGVAIPALRTIVLPTYPRPGGAPWDGTVTLRHELAHLAVHAYLPAPIPRWFDEGYATWVSGGWDQGSAWQIRAAFLLRRAPPLDSLTLEWPRGAEEARLAYLLSASAVQYLIEIGGEAGFAALLAEWRAGGDFEAALRRVYGMTSGQFEAAWARVVKRRYGWLLALSQITVFWTGAGLLLLVLYAVRRRRQRERLLLLEEDDRRFPPTPEWEGGGAVEEMPEEEQELPQEISEGSRGVVVERPGGGAGGEVADTRDAGAALRADAASSEADVRGRGEAPEVESGVDAPRREG